jgi:hypothetical protein
MIALYNSRTKRFNGELTHQVNQYVTVRTVRTVQVQEEGFPLRNHLHHHPLPEESDDDRGHAPCLR